MHIYKRYDSKRRLLSGPLLFCDLEEEIAQLKEDPEWHERHRNAVTLVKEPHLSVVLVALREGATLQEHRAPGAFTIVVLDGAVRLGIDNETRTVKRGGLVSMEKDIPHDVEALEETALLLTIAGPKP
ncbi:MAG TPA: cupin domain-containing protein [Verrucomicrobiae bacterium]|nr:cupin domain-containing protein [Verrucomicrobiae bacterium]